MRKEKPVEFDYGKFVKGDSMRSKSYDIVFNIVNGIINETRYRINYNDFNEARKCIINADIRVKIFFEDAIESGTALNGEVDYLYALVENARRDIEFKSKEVNIIKWQKKTTKMAKIK